jgi:hypothetical protein
MQHKKKYHLLDPDFDAKKNYFFKEIKSNYFDEMEKYFSEYFKKGEMNKTHLDTFFSNNKFRSLGKLTKNLETMQNK